MMDSIFNVRDLQATLFRPCRTAGSYISSFFSTDVTSHNETNAPTTNTRLLSKSEEEKDFLSLSSKEGAYAPRWPTECQVVKERIHHINYIPPSPELYYQPSGKEIQPKPVGEEAGKVVFQYNPISAVNYFSRSSVGGSPFVVAGTNENENDLKFESRFESGNLAKVVKITETYYELYIRTDLYTNRHMQWFYFRVQNTRKHIIYRFSLVNLSKGDSLYSAGMKPLLYSTKDAQLNAVGWRRCGDNITYYKNEPVSGEEDELANYTLSFNIEFPHDQDEVYLAHCYPYTYTDLQDYLSKLQNHPVKSNFTKLRLLCRSLAGNNVYYLTITEPSIGDEPKKKKAVVITARVHPGETPSSWMMKGFMDFLTGDSEQAKELRERFIFKLVPMLNPDGVIVGNNRCSLTGRDLNRQYRTVIRETYPSVWHTKLMIKRLIEECGIIMYCDLHAHSRKHNVFIYGCENKRYVDKKLQEQVFPLMLHKNAADKFSFESCKFRIQRSKEGTGRVVVWMMGVANSYTLEASFAGSTLGSRMDTHFSTQDFESIGRAFCETLLDFSDEDPSKERLRVKIIDRLNKEGSSADEPTNINLSDYSSDEGDTSSSSAECPTHKERNSNWARNDFITEFLPPRTPSSILPKKESKSVKQRPRGSSAKTVKKIIITEKTPPMPRKPLKIHKKTLDPPCVDQLNEGLDCTTEFESGDESPSWQKGSRKLRTDYREKKLKKRYMPPELIVTSAQVYETIELSEKETSKTPKNSSPEFKRKTVSSDVNSEKYRLWHHAKCLQTQSKGGKSISDLTTEVHLKLGTRLRQRIWTGCPCTVIQGDMPLSKGSLSFTHWSKGPLMWTSSFSSHSNNENLQRSSSQIPTASGPSGDEGSKQKKKKSWSKKTSFKSNKPLSQPEVDSDYVEYCKKSSKTRPLKFHKERDVTFPNENDPTTQVSLLQLRDSKSSKSVRKDNTETEDKCSTKSSKSARSKLRKGGLALTAVSRFRYDSADSEFDETINEKPVIKKKKKRRTSKKSKRHQPGKVVSESPSKSKEKVK